MDQRTHSWIAIRAIALLEEENKAKNLVSLLKPHARKASVGAWIPDDVDAKRGGAGSATDNHIFKTEPYRGDLEKRFIVPKNELLDHIGMHRMIARFLEKDTYLDDEWWSSPYKGDVPRPGQHLPNRIMALSTMLKDLLLIGDEQIDILIPGPVRFIKKVDANARTHEEAAAMYFFMLSHFTADICMPCHCDGRKLSGYSNGLHMELEKEWSKMVGLTFEKNSLLNDALALESEKLLQKAREVDSVFSLNFDSTIPDIHEKHDIWLEAIFLSRASFALASIVAPCREYPYDNACAQAHFKDLLGRNNEQVLNNLNQAVMYDAVLNTAIMWKHIWNKVSND